MSKFEEVQAKNRARRQRILDGKLNCIPLPFERFRSIFPGFEQGKYIIITANQKVGKSKLSDYLFIYEPLFYIVDHPEMNLKVKVLYFSLEMSADEKYNEFLCHLLLRLDGLHISTRDLRGVDRAYDPRIDELLNDETHQKYIRAFEDMVIFNDTDKNPTGINKKCRDYALAHGHMNYITYQATNELTGEVETKNGVDPIKPYTQDDPDEYRFIILDNAANITTEKGSDSKMAAIDKMSKYGITLRKQLNYIFVLIQHQAQSQEGVENIKLDRMRPTTDGLGDCKTTSRDANCVIGLFSPYKFKKKDYEEYDITKLQDYARFMEVLEDRDYGANGSTCSLFFDGATSNFKELPKATDIEGLKKYYRYIERLEQERLNPTLQLTNPK